MTEPLIRVDAIPPAEIAERAAEMGVRKANLKPLTMLMQAVLAGGFIALGALFATVTLAGTSGTTPFGLARLLYGLVFCLGLILTVLAGAELFTGNNLIFVAWASGRVRAGAVLRNWVIVYVGNLIGAVVTAVLVFVSKEYTFGSGIIGQTALTIANNKMKLDFAQATALGILCNALVCMAVWLTLGARTTTDKILAILFPITAFVAAGFEHSVANMYFVPIGLLIKQFDPAFVVASGLNVDALTLSGFINNLIPVTLGNLVGGVGMVAAVYWFIYLRER